MSDGQTSLASDLSGRSLLPLLHRQVAGLVVLKAGEETAAALSSQHLSFAHHSRFALGRSSLLSPEGSTSYRLRSPVVPDSNKSAASYDRKFAMEHSTGKHLNIPAHSDSICGIAHFQGRKLAY
jgi:hypothetical protein